jgi:hypothetical protein
MPQQLDNLNHTDHAVLIIEDLNAMWFQALVTRFPASLDVRFLAQHILRLGELKATYDFHNSLCEGYTTLVGLVDAEISRRLSGTTAHKDYYCRHIDGRVSRTVMNDKDFVCIAAPKNDEYRLESLSE